MTREELATASDLLESAADDTASDDASERLGDLADQLDRLSTADQGPDHGRLARIQSALNDVSSGDGEDVADTIDEADDAINEYRSGLEGV
ncbi:MULTISPECIES: DUF7553 family protein [Haloarcula]|uniref:Uncharacterized protein n=1 Tax=Haloarcula pellucida TaxID=1427151 RepID=A0A830GKJ1_9EURY|nr:MULTISPECIES: hypothetical protein [Halomicroarcula]MBX0348382.1 hypothetical protein [Halomicroarcula pellucida]MDS0278204.1 hypothetical protein [Halomicroarcula sp. S1AR25-4]QIO23856.1 hypothetical protein G9465_16475 [Haloarcula sp. JP-L23]GGN93625.1 hypothetical protein GCM10009030_19260 [Halomicroarcula pellucida]